MNVKIRNAELKDLVIVADMVRANVGTIERRGAYYGMSLVRGDLSVYLYLTSTGQSAVAYVASKDQSQ